jgi:hypothetical protein
MDTGKFNFMFVVYSRLYFMVSSCCVRHLNHDLVLVCEHYHSIMVHQEAPDEPLNYSTVYTPNWKGKLIGV